MIKVYNHESQGKRWIECYQGKQPILACILGFTTTGLIEGISAAGATPHDRQYTAIADAEFLINGSSTDARYPLPPLTKGASPVLISRAVVEALELPVYLFNAGLPIPPAVHAIDLGGAVANCVSSGKALPLSTVEHLFKQGLDWGKKLAIQAQNSYVIMGECVVGGTTTALGILTGLGINAREKVNSSHRHCNHQQKWQLVNKGLGKVGNFGGCGVDPLKVIAAVGDPMQAVVAGMAVGGSCYGGVLLAGGTQMLAVYALAKAIAHYHDLAIETEQVVIGTTRWVVEDLTGDTLGLAQQVGKVPLMATSLSFALSRYPQLRAYEQGFVKEGVGAGGCAIAASLARGWQTSQLLKVVEDLFESYSSAQIQQQRDINS